MIVGVLVTVDVIVLVAVAKLVGVLVAVRVAVAVGVLLGVSVNILVTVAVGVDVYVGDIFAEVKLQVLPVVTALPSSTVTYHSNSAPASKPGQETLAVEPDGIFTLVSIT